MSRTAINKPLPTPDERKAVLAEYLECSREMVADCRRRSMSAELDQRRLGYCSAAARLMQVGLQMVHALEHAELAYRFLVERKEQPPLRTSGPQILSR